MITWKLLYIGIIGSFMLSACTLEQTPQGINPVETSDSPINNIPKITPYPTSTITETFSNLPPAITTSPTLKPSITPKPTRGLKTPLSYPNEGKTIMDMGWINSHTYQVWGANFGLGIEPDPSCRGSFEWICYPEAGGHSVDKNDPDFQQADPNFWKIQNDFPWTYLGEYSIDGDVIIDFGGSVYTDILLTMPPHMGIDQISAIVSVDDEKIIVPYGYAYFQNRLVPVLLANDTYGFTEITLSKGEGVNHNGLACGILGGKEGLPDKSLSMAKYLVGESKSVLFLFRMINNPYGNVINRTTFPQSLSGLQIISIDLDPLIKRVPSEQEIDSGNLIFGEYTFCR